MSFISRHGPPVAAEGLSTPWHRRAWRNMARLQIGRLSVALGLVGMLVSMLLVDEYGLGAVLRSIGSIGWAGFAAYVAAQLGLFVLLGLAWFTIMPQRPWRLLPVLIWARAVRDAAGQFLPFSQMGGFVLGARVVALRGTGWRLATASTLADVTTEFLAELVFAALGLLVLLMHAPDSRLILPIGAGIGLALAGAAGFIIMQQGMGSLFEKLSARIGGGWVDRASAQADQLQAEVNLVYGRLGRLALGGAVHLLAWIATGGSSWLAYRLMGVDIDFGAALAIEALLHAALTASFFVPGALGVQEAVYATLGTVFGCPPEISIAVSLLRRGRDALLAVPILLLWQRADVAPAPARRDGDFGVAP